VAIEEKRVQTKKKFKLRLTTNAYELSYDYINYTINLVGRSFGKWRRKCLRSGGSRRVKRMSFGCRKGIFWRSTSKVYNWEDLFDRSLVRFCSVCKETTCEWRRDGQSGMSLLEKVVVVGS
jgi:hypothetical protein